MLLKLINLTRARFPWGTMRQFPEKAFSWFKTRIFVWLPNSTKCLIPTFQWFLSLPHGINSTVDIDSGAFATGTLCHTWWRHQMETFAALLAICAGNSPVPGEFPAQRPVTQSFDVFFDLRLNKRLSKQSWCWWFETLSRPLWRHSNDLSIARQVWQKSCKQSGVGERSRSRWTQSYEIPLWKLDDLDIKLNHRAEIRRSWGIIRWRLVCILIQPQEIDHNVKSRYIMKSSWSLSLKQIIRISSMSFRIALDNKTMPPWHNGNMPLSKQNITLNPYSDIVCQDNTEKYLNGLAAHQKQYNESFNHRRCNSNEQGRFLFQKSYLNPHAAATCNKFSPLQWRHNGRDGVSNHQLNHCLLNRLFRRRSKKTSNIRVTGLSVGNSPVTGEFPAQMASNAEHVSVWWRHHENILIIEEGMIATSALLISHFMNEMLANIT